MAPTRTARAARIARLGYDYAAQPKQALTRSTEAFGRPRIPPRLAFAPWNDTIGGSDKVREFAQYLREQDIPSSAIWYEDWRGGRFVA